MTTKHPGGRPTVATPENVAKAWEYIESGWQTREKFPTVEGLALTLRISKESLYAREEFSDALAEIRGQQVTDLIAKGLDGTYNSAIVKLMLTAKHGFVEQSDITSGGKSLVSDVKELTDEQLNARIEEYLQNRTKPATG
jgi:hypothetical protein